MAWMENNELTIYSNETINQIVLDVIKNTLHNPKETKFLLDYRKQSKKAIKVRVAFENKGQHIPAFLISSITNSCNLFCKGCYARKNNIGCEDNTKQLLTVDEWGDIFSQASKLGIGFQLLAGGEPLIRRDVIQKAATFSEVIFPIFTNGTLIDNTYCELFDQHRNLIPVLSLEGEQKTTDNRRGDGVYRQLLEKMKLLNQYKILFGVSITVTKENMKEVTAIDFSRQLQSLGCRLVFFVEYVPVDNSTIDLAFTDKERAEFEKYLNELKASVSSVLFLSFPGDEKNIGGCMAAGRGFFHVNPFGDAEACPFSPYSDRNLKNYSILDVLQSPFFMKLQKNNLVGGEHTGGCALFENQGMVKHLLNTTD